MSNDLLSQESSSIPAKPGVSWTRDQVELIKRTIAIGASDDELRLFLYQAKRTGLDPLSRQIHFVKRKEKGTIQTSIDGYRLIADRTGKYAGSDDYLFDEGINEFAHIQANRGDPVTATVTVYKSIDGERCPFTATARWDEYAPSDEKSQFMWRKMPYLMIGKCAEALALRKAFPAELSGLYTDEEMMQAEPGRGAPKPTLAVEFQPDTVYVGILKSYVPAVHVPKGQKGAKPQQIVVDVDGAELKVGGFNLPDGLTKDDVAAAQGMTVQISYALQGNFKNLAHLAIKPAEDAVPEQPDHSAGASGDISDDLWTDFRAYCADDADRNDTMKTVLTKTFKVRTLDDLAPGSRKPFVLSVQDAWKRQGLTFEPYANE